MKEKTIEPLVSIVTPSFNQGLFIEDTIKSVLGQEGPFFLEYIIIDGGSKDNSLEVIRKYDELLKDNKVPVKCKGITYRWVSEKDRGQSHAINKGFKMAKGDFVAWLNSDDYYLPGALKAALAPLLADKEVAMAYGNGFEVDKAGKNLNHFKSRAFDLKRLVELEDYILQPTVLMRRSALEKAGYLKEDLHWCMDWDLWIRLGSTRKAAFVAADLACSRVYEDTKTASGGLKRLCELSSLMRAHSGKRLTKGVFFYGYGLVMSGISRKAPFLEKLIRPAARFVGMRLYKKWE